MNIVVSKNAYIWYRMKALRDNERYIGKIKKYYLTEEELERYRKL